MKNYNLAAWLVLLLTFVVLFFLIIDTEKDNAAWVSFFFVLLSFAAIPITYLLRNEDNGTQVLSYSLYKICYTYFVCEIVVALLFLLIFPGHKLLSVATQLILFAVFVTTIMVHKGANVATTESLNALKQDGAKIRDWKSQLELIKIQCCNPELLQALSRSSDLIASMPIGIVSLTASIDNEVSVLIANLGNALQNDDIVSAKALCDNLVSKLEQRKLIVKNSNE